jgi:hypothetical protein
LWEEGPIVEELYDHRDPKCNVPANFDLCEDENVAGMPEFAPVMAKLREKLTRVVRKNNKQHWDQVFEQQAAADAKKTG